MNKMESIEKRREEVIQYLTERLPSNQVEEVRSLLAKYFLEKADEEFDKLARNKGWTAETYEQWLNEHNRTPYQ